MSIKFIQLPPCKIVAFLSNNSTSFDVAGFLYNDGTTKVAITDIGDICYATLEPSTERAELISFTIDSVTAVGVATLTVIRGLSQSSPYGTGGATFTHQAGSNLVISNNPALFNKLAAKANDETITGDWKVPTPVTITSIVNKAYSDTKVSKTGAEIIAGVKTFSSIPIIPVTTPTLATQAISKSYLDAVVVKKTGAQTIAGIKTFSSSPVVPDAVNPNQPYTKGQHDADAVAASTTASPTVRGTLKIDTTANIPSDPVALTATTNRVGALVGGGNIGTPSTSNKFVTEEYIANAGILKFGGNGSDSALAVASGTTTIDLGGAQFFEKNYTTIAITGTGKLNFTNPHANGTIIVFKVNGNVTLTSSQVPMIDITNTGATGGASVNSSSSNTVVGLVGLLGKTYGFLETNFGNGGQGSGTGGTAGGVGTFGFTAGISTLINIFAKYPKLFLGAGAGSGAVSASNIGTGSLNSGKGGRGGGAFILECGGALDFQTTGGISVSGEVGGNGVVTGSVNDGSAAGGGGGGGGYCMLLYKTLTNGSGTITSAGGVGGNQDITAASNVAGGGGGGGSILAGNAGTNSSSNGAKVGGNGAIGVSLIAQNTEFS